MVKLPSDDIDYKRKEFMLSLYEEFANSSKLWFVVLGLIIILAIPGNIILKVKFTEYLITKQVPVQVTNTLQAAKDLIVSEKTLLPVQDESYSVVFKLFNPNSQISAQHIEYEISLLNAKNELIKIVPGNTYLSNSQSKFVLINLTNLATAPAGFDVNFKKIKWTNREPKFKVELSAIGQNSGSTAEGLFFVEGLIKNPEAYQIRTVDLPVLVFDKAGNQILAAGLTSLSDLNPFENRYFRIVWPVSEKKLFPKGYGYTEISPQVNFLNPSLVIPDSAKLPSR